jgi:hypothetical protein
LARKGQYFGSETSVFARDLAEGRRAAEFSVANAAGHRIFRALASHSFLPQRLRVRDLGKAPGDRQEH